MKTYWMSFCDPEKPQGQQFLGVCIVDVSATDAARIRPELRARFPHHQVGAEWFAAAVRKAHALSCNPGGEIHYCECPREDPKTAQLPRNRLLSRAEIEALEANLLSNDPPPAGAQARAVFRVPDREH